MVAADGKADSSEDAKWIKAAKAGDREAFDVLVELYGRAVMRYMQNLTGSTADAEDLTQDALIQAFKAINTFKDGTDFRAWLLKIAYHEWIHRLRKKKRVTAVDPEKLRDFAGKDAVVKDDELAASIHESIQQLPEDQRIVVALRFGEGLSHTQIAEMTDAEPATVRWRLFRARQTLQKLLKKWVDPREAKK
jgi:RNA polymerase sigma-70 factor, ECF subfamily